MCILLESEALSLVRYDDTKEAHRRLLQDFESGESKSDFISYIPSRLKSSSTRDVESLFQSAYVVVDEEGVPIGYAFISNKKDDIVALECSILSRYRGQGYGRRLLNGLTNHLFSLNIRAIQLDIDQSNSRSIKSAEKCGFIWDPDVVCNNGKLCFIKDNFDYRSTRRK